MDTAIIVKYKPLAGLFIFTLLSFTAASQTVIPLYTGKIPNSIAGPGHEIWDTVKGRILVRKVSLTTLTDYFPEKEKANGTALIIIPGGGYHHVEISNVGFKIAAEFIKFGVTCFVLKYRLPNDTIMVLISYHYQVFCSCWSYIAKRNQTINHSAFNVASLANTVCQHTAYIALSARAFAC